MKIVYLLLALVLVVTALIALTLLGIGEAFVIGGVRLLTGWVTFLPERLPKATVNWGGVGMLLVCAAVTAAFAHNFCSWFWRGTGHETHWQPRWTGAGLGVLILLFISGMAVTGVAHQVGWLMHGSERIVINTGSNERGPGTSLKTITSAQADFRANDRDWNHIHDFWRKDIAGLYAVEVDGVAQKLIELSVAAADDSPKTPIEKHAERSPKAGYWFRALLHEDEKPDAPDPERFAACTFPVNSSAGRWMYIVCEDNRIWRKDFAGQVPAAYPKNPLADGWEKVD